MKKSNLAVGLIAVTMTVASPALAKAEDVIEKAGVVTGVTAGNMWFLPLKAISMTFGAVGGALSYVVTLGNSELTEQIWRDTSEGPYIITPEVAHMAIGERPELPPRK